MNETMVQLFDRRKKERKGRSGEGRQRGREEKYQAVINAVEETKREKDQ